MRRIEFSGLIRACKDFAIADIEAKWLQVTVLETTLALVEHGESLVFVGLDGGYRPFQHRFSFACCAILSLGECRSGERHCNGCKGSENDFAKHNIFLLGLLLESLIGDP